MGQDGPVLAETGSPPDSSSSLVLLGKCLWSVVCMESNIRQIVIGSLILVLSKYCLMSSHDQTTLWPVVLDVASFVSSDTQGRLWLEALRVSGKNCDSAWGATGRPEPNEQTGCFLDSGAVGTLLSP